MLEKAVCMKCVDDYARKSKAGQYSYWDSTDDDSWKENVIECPYKDSPWDLADVKNPPPKNCLHMFEHAVAYGRVSIDKKDSV